MNVSQQDQARNKGGAEGRSTPLPFFENKKKSPYFWKKMPWLCPFLG